MPFVLTQVIHAAQNLKNIRNCRVKVVFTSTLVLDTVPSQEWQRLLMVSILLFRNSLHLKTRIHASVWPLSISLSIHQTIHLSIHLSIHVSVDSSIYFFYSGMRKRQPLFAFRWQATLFHWSGGKETWSHRSCCLTRHTTVVGLGRQRSAREQSAF